LKKQEALLHLFRFWNLVGISFLDSILLYLNCGRNIVGNCFTEMWEIAGIFWIFEWFLGQSFSDNFFENFRKDFNCDFCLDFWSFSVL
jgi:hypothetical protein